MNVRTIKSGFPFSLVSGTGLGTSASSYSQIGSFLPDETLGDANLDCQINLANGNLFQRDRLLTFSDINGPVSFSYIYNNQDHTWRLAYGRQIEQDGSNLYVIEADGRKIKYDYNPENDSYYASEYTTGRPILKIKKDGSGYTIYNPDTRVTETFGSTGYLQSTSDKAGNETKYDYLDNRLNTIIAPSGVQYEFRNSDNKIEVVIHKLDDSQEVLHTYYFDDSNQLEKSITRDGYEISYKYNDKLDLERIAQLDGTSLTFEYDDAKVTKIKLGDGDTNINYISYDQNQTSFKDAAGTTSILKYDENAHPVEFNQDETLTTYKVTPEGQLETTQYADGSTATIQYSDQTKLATKKIERDGTQTVFVYSEDEEPQLLVISKVSEDDLIKQTTHLVYKTQENSKPLVKFTISPLGTVEELVRDENGLVKYKRKYLKDVFDNDNKMPNLADLEEWVEKIKSSAVGLTNTSVEKYKYDAQGRITATKTYAQVDKNGKGVKNTAQEVKIDKYNEWGNVLETSLKTSDGFLKTKNHFNDLGRNLEIILGAGTPQSQKTTTTYEQFKSTTILPNRDLKKTLLKDSQGLLLSSSDQLKANDQAARTTKFSNFIQENVCVATMPDQIHHVIDFYDGKKRIGATVSPVGAAITYEYNDQFRYVIKTQHSYPVNINELYNGQTSPQLSELYKQLDNNENTIENRVSCTFLDTASNPRFEVDPAGYLVEYRYNLVGKLTATIEYGDKLTDDELRKLLEGVDVERTLDRNKDRITQNFYNNDNLLIATQDASGYVTEFVLDAAGRTIDKINYDKPNLSVDQNYAAVKPILTEGKDAHHYYFYNSLDEVYLEVGSEGTIIQTKYDFDGKIRSTIEFATKVPDTWYQDTNNPPEPVPSSEDNITFYSYDDLRRRKTISTSNGKITSIEYDSMDNIISTQTRDVRNLLNTNGDYLRGTQTQYNSWGEETKTANALTNQLLVENPNDKDKIWDESSIRYTYNEFGLKTKITDSLGNTSIIYYDANDKPIIIINPVGAVTHKLLNVFGELLTKVQYYKPIPNDLLGGLTGGYIDNKILEILAALPDSSKDIKTKYQRDQRGLIQQKTDPEDNVSTFEYNAFSECKVENLPIGSKEPSLRIEHEFDARGLETKTTKTNTNKDSPQITQKEYNSFLGKCTKEVNPENGESKYEWDRLGNLLNTYSLANIDSSNGNKTYITSEKNEYDAFSRVQQTVNADDVKIVINYNQIAKTRTSIYLDGSNKTVTNNIFGESVSETEGKDDIISKIHGYEHVADGQVNKELNGISADVITNHNLNGDKVELIDSNGTKSTYKYDAATNPTETVIDQGNDQDHLNITASIVRNALGQAEVTTNPRKVNTINEFDRCGRIKKSTLDMGNGVDNPTTEKEYNAEGSETLKKTGNKDDTNKKIQEYDGYGRLQKEIIDPDNLKITTTYERNKLGRVVKETDANGNVTRVYYNLLKQKCFQVSQINNTQMSLTQFIYTPGNKPKSTRVYNTPLSIDSITDQTTLEEISGTATKIQSFQDSQNYLFYDANGRVQFKLKLFYDYATTKELAIVEEINYDFADRENCNISYVKALEITDITSLTTQAIADQMHPLKDDPKNRILYRWYDEASQERLIIDQSGFVVQKDYNAAGKLITKTEYGDLLTSAAQYLNLPYNQIPLNTTSDKNRVLNQVYDACNRLTYIVRANGQVFRMKYDEVDNSLETCKFHDKISQTNNYNELVAKLNSLKSDPNIDSITQTTYYKDDNVESIIDALTNVDKFERDALGRTKKHIDRDNFEWKFEHDGANRTIFEISPETNVTDIKRDEETGILSFESNRKSVVTKTEHDGLGNPIKITKGYGLDDSRSIDFTYNKQGPSGTSQVAFINDNDFKEPITPDLKTLPNKKETLTTAKIYNTKGQIVAEQNVNGKWKYNVYDAAKRLAFTISASGAVIGYKRDMFGDIIEETKYAERIKLDLTTVNPQVITPELIANSLTASSDDRILYKEYNHRGQEVNIKQKAILFYVDGKIDKAQPEVIKIYNIFGDCIYIGSSIKLEEENIWSGNYSWYNNVGETIAIVDPNNYLKIYDLNLDGQVAKISGFADALTITLTPSLAATLTPAQLIEYTNKDNPDNSESELGYDRLGQNTSTTILNDTVQVITTENGIPELVDRFFEKLTVTKTYSKRQKETSTTYEDGISTEYKYYDERNDLCAQTEVTRSNVYADHPPKITPLTVYKLNAYSQPVVVQTSPDGCGESASPDTLPTFLDTANVIEDIALLDNRGLTMIKQDGELNQVGYTYDALQKEARSLTPISLEITESTKGDRPHSQSEASTSSQVSNEDIADFVFVENDIDSNIEPKKPKSRSKSKEPMDEDVAEFVFLPRDKTNKQKYKAIYLGRKEGLNNKNKEKVPVGDQKQIAFTKTKHLDEVRKTYHDNLQLDSINYFRDNVKESGIVYSYNTFAEMDGYGLDKDNLAITKKFNTSGYCWFSSEDEEISTIILTDLKGVETLKLTCTEYALALVGYDDIPEQIEKDPSVVERVETTNDLNGRPIAVKYNHWYKDQTDITSVRLPSVQYAYDYRDNITKTTDSLGNATTATFNKRNYKTSETSPPVEVSDGTNSTTQTLTTKYGYNLRGYQIGTTDANNHTTVDILDESGQQVAKILADGTIPKRLILDALSRILYSYDARGKLWAFKYNKVNSLTESTLPSGRVFNREYNEKQDLTSVTDPGGVTNRYNPDIFGNVWEHIQPLGQITRTVYDINRLPLQKISLPSNYVLSWSRSFTGHPLDHTDYGQTVITNKYDFKWQLVQEFISTGYRSYECMYEKKSLVSFNSLTRVLFNPYVGQVPVIDKTLTWKYGLLTRIVDNGISQITDYTHDSEGRPDSLQITGTDGNLLLLSKGIMDALGRFTQIDLIFDTVFPEKGTATNIIKFDAADNVMQNSATVSSPGYTTGSSYQTYYDYIFSCDAADRVLTKKYSYGDYGWGPEKLEKIYTYQNDYRVNEAGPYATWGQGLATITNTDDGVILKLTLVEDVFGEAALRYDCDVQYSQGNWINYSKELVQGDILGWIDENRIDEVNGNNQIVKSSYNSSWDVTSTTTNTIDSTNSLITEVNIQGSRPNSQFTETITNQYISFDEHINYLKEGSRDEDGINYLLDVTKFYFDANRQINGKTGQMMKNIHSRSIKPLHYQ